MRTSSTVRIPGASKPIKAGQSFSQAFIVGYFDNIEEMTAVYDAHKGNTKLIVENGKWRLEK